MRRLRATQELSQEVRVTGLRAFQDQYENLLRGSLAHECGINRTYLSAVERSERNVSIDNIARIARVFRSSRGGY